MWVMHCWHHQQAIVAAEKHYNSSVASTGMTFPQV
jgi:hypothetical protein